MDPTIPNINTCTTLNKINQPWQHKKFCLFVSDEGMFLISFSYSVQNTNNLCLCLT